MSLDLVNLRFLDRPVTKKEGLQILERDEYRCQYCGLDGRASFENALAMSVDFVVPRARKGKKDPHNLVACCRSCNMIKGKHVYRSFDEAKAHVLKRRTDLRRAWERTPAQPGAKPAKAPEARTPAAEPEKARAAAAAGSVVSSSPLSLRKG
ncbi:MAG TPA: HNH endonuclease [Candidatus Acidoferrales bacterium]|nr:HNH endonuclease [Candidatus Acidoferrales bacterium]